MLKKIIIIENENKYQCDTQKEVIEQLLDNNYYKLNKEEKYKKRKTKALANCINNKFKVVETININKENIDNKFIIKDEKTYVLSLLMTNNITLLEQIKSNIYTSDMNKKLIKENYIIVNKFAKKILEIYLKQNV